MPNIKSQEKRDRQNKKKTIKNKVLKSKIKTAEKRLETTVNENNLSLAQEKLNTFYKVLDKAAKKSAVHKNYSANKKSKAARLVNSLNKPEKKEQ